MKVRSGFTVGLVVLFLNTSAAAAEQRTREPIATTSHFSFYSDFETNLNDALIVAGTARNRDQSELFEGGEEQACFSELPPSAQLGWNLAVDYYAQVISPEGWKGRQQFLVRTHLADIEYEADERATRFMGIADGFLATASPAYEACRWSHQDAENRAWVEALLPKLEEHEAVIAQQLERHYATSWHGLPILVDVVATAPWTGANSIYLSPEGGHVLISSALAEGDALETVFHEASHTLMRGRDPIPQALAAAAEQLQADPGDLWHVLLFYTTGETVRGVLEEAGEPGYTPYIDSHDLWSGSWAPWKQPVEHSWPAYLNGERALDEVIVDLLRSVAEAE